MERMKLEIMDWKSIEKASEDGIREALIAISLHEIARKQSKDAIHDLGGLTNEEEDEKARTANAITQ